MAPVSVLPGRLRLECEAIKGRQVRSCALEGRIGTIAGVLDVAANFRTGRILVRFDEEIIPRAALAERIETLTNAPEACGECPEAVPLRAARPVAASTTGRRLLLDIAAHAFLPRPFDLLVPAISVLRR